MFITAALTVVSYYLLGFFTTPQFIFAVIVMPMGFTLTEAYAPHTWDNPLLVAVGFFMTWFTLDIVDPTPQTVDALMKLDLAAGVDVEIKL